MNDMRWTTIKRAQIEAVKQPVSLLQQDGKRMAPHGMGCNSPGYLCRVAHKSNCEGTRSSCHQSIGQHDS